MSKLSDYSKFDHLEDSDDESEHEAPPQPSTEQPRSAPPPATASARFVPHPEKPLRFLFQYQDRTIYEWDQSLTEVTLYVPAPPQLLNASRIFCSISSSHLQLGQRGANVYFIDEDTFQTVDTDESTWCIEDEFIVIYLQKANKGVVWDAALKGRFDVTLDPAQHDKVQQALLLERFQEENPGMDFRGASFNGSVPDPRTFMGGVKYS